MYRSIKTKPPAQRATERRQRNLKPVGKSRMPRGASRLSAVPPENFGPFIRCLVVWQFQPLYSSWSTEIPGTLSSLFLSNSAFTFVRPAPRPCSPGIPLCFFVQALNSRSTAPGVKRRTARTREKAAMPGQEEKREWKR